MPDAVRVFVDALNALAIPVYLILRDHPRVVAPDASEEFKHIYTEYKDIPRELRYGKVVDTSVLKSSDLINFGSDVVVAMYSTALLEACYLGKPCLSVWVPAAKDALSMETKGALSDFPPASLGACLAGGSSVKIARHLEAIFKGEEALRRLANAQTKHYANDGQSALRVCQVLWRFTRS